MEWSVWLAFLVAATLVLIVPGPTILLVITQSIQHGRAAALSLVGGVALGDFIAVSASLLGLGVILATSAILFNLMKWVGAAYLIYLGIQMWRSPPALEPSGQLNRASGIKHARMFGQACLVTALNPKGIIFFMAFVPQFINPHAPATPQLLTMAATFLILAVVNAGLYAFFAAAVRDKLQRRDVRAVLQRGGGTALIGAGIATAALQR